QQDRSPGLDAAKVLFPGCYGTPVPGYSFDAYGLFENGLTQSGETCAWLSKYRIAWWWPFLSMRVLRDCTWSLNFASIVYVPGGRFTKSHGPSTVVASTTSLLRVLVIFT